ncbi:tRNA (adenosine(37)-N6)-threonylcarbamoyltransferase complex dimerization subunit type 1 TsaB [Edaphobacter bradus]|uniref:tRNA (adenosine(37)-N6)-threonylcarbamoyltransferase complex dimerization subunit type 1 TsaB n=1 Tax=Edaphobacter bradus TaxID=2259016 RepID=UPI0021DFA56C|nr:tRNA (adenosine(37)-N6)-threonylcarbamoyltransferase complex dimerization subunit type 1 TsaB [Edaphobacter bradus]
MMRLLLMDTCGSEGSVALAETGREPAIIASERLPGRSSSERLMPTVRRLLEANGWRLSDLTAIAVVHGPGSFTGVRVGLSAAKGLSEAGGVPVIAVSRLAVLAGLTGESDVRVNAVLDAGRGEFYIGEYEGHRRVREELMEKVEVGNASVGGSIVVCEATVANALAELKPMVVKEPAAEDALALALERVAAAEFDDVATLDANYLRRTDAQIFAKPKSVAS